MERKNSCSETVTQFKANEDGLRESKGGLSVAVERCPLCSESKRPFYCKSCVQSGKFTYSSATYPDSYDELHRKWEINKRERDHFLESLKVETEHTQGRDAKHMAIEECRRKIQQLKASLEATKDMIDKDLSVLDAEKKLGKLAKEKIQREYMMKYRKSKKHREKRTNIMDYVKKVSVDVKKKKDHLAEKEEELMSLRQKRVDQLTTYIFDISEVKNKSTSQVMGSSDEIQQALQEASETAYVSGRWIDSSDQYRIINSTLPSHGNYAEYYAIVSSRVKDDGSSEGGEGESCGATSKFVGTDPGDTINAGLCYTSQLMATLADILHVPLPNRLNHGDFSRGLLPQKEFNGALSRLNQNVLYMCFSQDVNRDSVQPKHTLHNILLVLNSPHLGRCGRFTVIQEMLDSVDDPERILVDAADSDELDASGWESVPDNINIPELEMPQERAPSQVDTESQAMSESTMYASTVISSVMSYFSRK